MSVKSLKLIVHLMRSTWICCSNHGVLYTLYEIFNYFKYFSYSRKNSAIYDNWIDFYERKILTINPLDYNPLISIIIPVYNVKECHIIACIESVFEQTYTNWQLCIVDDYSKDPRVHKILDNYDKISKKVKVIYRKENGHISKASNDGAEIADGDFITFLDCDDLLSPNALYEVVLKLNEEPDCDLIYSDEDKISDDSKLRYQPFFKPDWSPDTLLSHMYICHLAVYRTTLFRQCGGFTIGLEGAQDYDLALRATELTDKISHIPKILYHWRASDNSTALNLKAKPYVIEAERRLKVEALKRRSIKGELEYIADIKHYRIKYIPDESTFISIIIPSKDNDNPLEACLNSIRKNHNEQKIEIIIVDNGSTSDNKKKYQLLSSEYSCKYIYQPMEFNFSRMCNLGAKEANGNVLLFLNDDIEVITEDWLLRMAGHARVSHVGAVGAKLYYPKGTIIQHDGVIKLLPGPSHALQGLDDKQIYYFGINRLDSNFMAVTGACLMVEYTKFMEVGGFDESFDVTYNDVDLCLKLLKKKYFNVVRNDVLLYHHESLSRGDDRTDLIKLQRLTRSRISLNEKWKEYTFYDPFFSPNLSSISNDYMTCTPPDSYVPLNINISENNINNSLIKYSIDFFYVSDEYSYCLCTGWSYLCKYSFNDLCDRFILLINKNNETTFEVPVTRITHLGSPVDGGRVQGFYAHFTTDCFPSGSYQVAIGLKTAFKKRRQIALTNKIIQFN